MTQAIPPALEERMRSLGFNVTDVPGITDQENDRLMAINITRVIEQVRLDIPAELPEDKLTGLVQLLGHTVPNVEVVRQVPQAALERGHTVIDLRYLRNAFDAFIADFTDIKERLFWFVEVLEALKEVAVKTPPTDRNRHHRQLAIMLFDAIRRSQVELLTEDHLNVIVQVWNFLQQSQITRHEILEADRILRRNGLDWMRWGE